MAGWMVNYTQAKQSKCDLFLAGSSLWKWAMENLFYKATCLLVNKEWSDCFAFGRKPGRSCLAYDSWSFLEIYKFNRFMWLLNVLRDFWKQETVSQVWRSWKGKEDWPMPPPNCHWALCQKLMGEQMIRLSQEADILRWGKKPLGTFSFLWRKLMK